MAIEINIKPEDIDQLVRDAVMRAGLGKAVEQALAKALTGYNNPVDDEVKRFVAEIVRELIRAKYAEHVRSAVAKAVEEKVTTELIDKTIAAATDKLVRAAEDRY